MLAPGNVADYNQIYTNWLAPLKEKLHKVTHNYVKIVVRKSADPFDSWNQTVNNWVTLAQAARDAGLEGVLFYNEEYYEQMWDYPGDVKYPSKTLGPVSRTVSVAGTASHASDNGAMADRKVRSYPRSVYFGQQNTEFSDASAGGRKR